jgi:hypothetical protein
MQFGKPLAMRALCRRYAALTLVRIIFIMQDKITALIDYLNQVKTRCTYSAAAEALGITPQALKKLLGERRPEISWLVNSGTEEPAGYTDNEKHPELYRTKRVIKSAEVLTRNLHW